MRPLLLLHGALGAAVLFDPLVTHLEAQYSIHRLDFSGHGGRPFPEHGYSMQGFVGDVIAYLDENGLAQVDIFGYSMGGYVALCLAKEHPERVGKIFTLATKFAWTPEAAATETKMLNPEKIAEKVPKFAAALEARHAPQDWKEVLRATADMMISLGDAPVLSNAALEDIPHKCLIAVGDQDQMVTREESVRAAKLLTNGEFAAMADTPHPIEQVDAKRLGQWITEFIN